MTDKSPQAFRTISEVADELDLPQHVLRFWETKFSQIRPMKRSSGRRFYRPEDVELVRVIRELLYGQGYTIRGVQKLLKERGARGFVESAHASVASEQEDERLQEDAAGPEEPAPQAERLAMSVVAELRAMQDELLACARILEEARQPGA